MNSQTDYKHRSQKDGMKTFQWVAMGTVIVLTVFMFVKPSLAHDRDGSGSSYNNAPGYGSMPGYNMPGYGGQGYRDGMGQGMPRPGGMNPGHHKKGHGGMMHQLGLSDDQRSEMKSIKRAYNKRWRDLRDDLSDTRETLYDLMNDKTLNESAVKKAADNLADLIAKRIVLRANQHFAVMGVLNEEQRKKHDEIKGDMNPFYGHDRGYGNDWRY